MCNIWQTGLDSKTITVKQNVRVQEMMQGGAGITVAFDLLTCYTKFHFSTLSTILNMLIYNH